MSRRYHAYDSASLLCEGLAQVNRQFAWHAHSLDIRYSNQVMNWRRKYNETPPEAEGPLQQAILEDRRYEGIEIPSTESLAAVTERVEEFYKDTLIPALRDGRTVTHR